MCYSENLTPRDNIDCCGINSSTHLCCKHNKAIHVQNLVVPSIMISTLIVVPCNSTSCGTNAYNHYSHRYCRGKVVPRGDSTSCCGTIPYNCHSQVDCNETVSCYGSIVP